MSRREVIEQALAEATREGPIPFRTFMDLALYHPEGGFYTRPEMRVGVGGDFHTSPTIHPAFGQCMARQLAQFWVLMGKPRVLELLELGAGSGQLAEQVLTELDRLKLGWTSVRYAILEKSPALRDRQAERLAPWSACVRWADSLEDLAPDGTWQGIVLSNELFDALPVHRVIGLKDGLAEIAVMRTEAGRYRQVGIVPTTPRLAAVLRADGITLQEGQRAEVNLAALDLMERLGTWLQAGFVLTVDYGGEAREVYAPHRKKGTIRGYYKQLKIEDPLTHPGEQDLTADVDFTALMRVGQHAGLRALGLVPQGAFLLHLGIEEIEQETVKDLKSHLEADLAIFGIRKLYRPEGMGMGFWVLVQSKGLETPPAAISGLSGTPWPRPVKRRWPFGR